MVDIMRKDMRIKKQDIVIASEAKQSSDVFTWGRGGMTLIEVMVAFAIVAVVSLSMLVGFTTIANTNMKADEFTKADEVLEEAIANDKTAAPTHESSIDQSISLTWTPAPPAPPAPDVTLPSKIYTYKDPETGKTFELLGKA
jgi:prepilin-type N-terminal cleavage/methylation domain-containing protein